MGRGRPAQCARYDRRDGQPGLVECARRWWPFVVGSLGVTAVLLGAYLMVPRETGAAAAERRTEPRFDARRAGGAAAAVTPQMRALGITGRISAYTTRYTAGEPRVRNIELAARALNGQVASPGSTFSFNRAIGARTKRRGYVPAPTIIGRRLVDDVGGGICQVSTTLFNAVFDAGLDIRDARAHTLWMPEYPQGREAAVAFPDLDFTWRNDTGRPVMVTTEFTGTALTVALWGTRRYEVRSRSSRRYGLTAYGSEADRGHACVPMRGGQGFQIDVWRVLVLGGREIRRQRFHTEYEPQLEVTCA
ncbi:VanW family protein [Spirillospora sp. NBC_01491]|uniref:VanW family protein n=1 Tax=Spirillospora sp. NBC_01491 TaxID=2976007 RepID=UPI002E378962|nr:VanW family protein [Spirillospora sp. NBC_01491]